MSLGLLGNERLFDGFSVRFDLEKGAFRLTGLFGKREAL